MKSERRLEKKRITEIDFPHWNFKIKIIQNPHTFGPSNLSIFFAKTLECMTGETVLDIGTGSGFLSIVASRLGATSVVATDISLDILKHARRNAKINGLSNICFKLGSIYDPVEGIKFSTIICNPPQMPFPQPLNRAIWGEKDGTLIMNQVIDGASEVLKDSGSLLISLLSVNNIEMIKSRFEERKFKVKIKSQEVQPIPLSPQMLQILDYLKSLGGAEILWINNIPHWRCLVLSGKVVH